MDYEIDIQNILEGDWQNLLNVKRLGVQPMLNPLSVAEHTWLVTMLATRMVDEIGIINDYKFEGGYSGRYSTFKLDVILGSTFHDIEEAIIGDIPRLPQTREEFKPAKDKAVACINEILFNGNEYLAYDLIRRSLAAGLPGKIIHYCDVYSLLIECLREKRLGNTYLDSITGKALGLMGSLLKFPIKGTALSNAVSDYLEENYRLTSKYVDVTYGYIERDWSNG